MTIEIGDKVKDKKSGLIEAVTAVTSNSFEVTRTKTSEMGINCTNWFDEKRFKENFELLKSL